MIYQQFKDIKLSFLAMGTMRLPLIGGREEDIDEPAATAMVDYAMSHGVNYYDTAWGYHGGNSEGFIGRALALYPRDSYYLASKFPGYDLANMDKVESIFTQQLARCGVDHFDFYLVHNVCELNIDAYLDAKYGVMAYLKEQQKAGRIKYLGFSVHGSYDVTKRFLAAYGDCMQFCQVQLNYIDWSFQNAKAKLELLAEYDIPVWVMEPLRGGKLAALPDEAAAKLRALRPDEDAVSWAYRFLQTLPQVTLVLTGASTLQQLQQNIAVFEQTKPLNPRELQTLLAIAEQMISELTLSCTACRYCTSHCPQQLDIPYLLELYNEHCFTGGGFMAPMAFQSMPEDKLPGACLACGACEAVCPQQIEISAALADFVARLKQ